ncbi:MAG: hypothetical protein AAB731_00270 [Patescibacteria group bacterium]
MYRKKNRQALVLMDTFKNPPKSLKKLEKQTAFFLASNECRCVRPHSPNAVMMIVFGGFMALAAIVFGLLMLSGRFHLSSLLMVLAYLSASAASIGGGLYLDCRAMIRDHLAKYCRPNSSKLNPAEVIPLFLSTALDSEKAALLGEGSEIQNIELAYRKLLEGHRNQTPDESSGREIAEVNHLVGRAALIIDGLAKYRQTVESAFSSLGEKVSAIRELLAEYELASEMEGIDNSAEAAKQQLEQKALITVSEILGEMKNIHEENSNHLKELVSFGALQSGDFDKDLAAIEKAADRQIELETANDGGSDKLLPSAEEKE